METPFMFASNLTQSQLYTYKHEQSRGWGTLTRTSNVLGRTISSEIHYPLLSNVASASDELPIDILVEGRMVGCSVGVTLSGQDAREARAIINSLPLGQASEDEDSIDSNGLIAGFKMMEINSPHSTFCELLAVAGIGKRAKTGAVMDSLNTVHIPRRLADSRQQGQTIGESTNQSMNQTTSSPTADMRTSNNIRY